VSQRQLHGVLHYLRNLTHHERANPETDGQLLDRFVAGHDETAFTELMQRHGRLVWSVCRRVLADGHNAEDAFQATFLVLVRKASSVGKRESVRSWLYGVAYRVAVRARQTLRKRSTQELIQDVPAGPDSSGDPVWLDVWPVLDEEVNRLPEKYRLPMILCYLEGKTSDEAADELGCPRGTIASRLARARERLRARLARRGVTVSAGALASALAQHAGATDVPTALTTSTLETVLTQLGKAGTAAGALATPAVLLAEGVIHAMIVTKLQTVLVLLLALGLLGTGAGLAAWEAGEKPGPTKTAPAPPAQADKDAKQEADPKAKPEAQEDKAPEPPRDLELVEALKRRVKFNGADDPKATLSEVLDILSNRFNLTFSVNAKAFADESIADVLKYEVANPNPLPPMHARLDTILRQVLSRVPSESGATWIIRNDLIEVTTQAALKAELGRKEHDTVLPLVHAAFVKQSLDDALKQLVEGTSYNLVLDSRVGDKAKVGVTATLKNVPLDTAVRVLADMADLQPAVVDNVLYVTTRENATRIEAEQKKRQKQDDPTLGGIRVKPARRNQGGM
jgi:RNA polymerase sigma factor (sigma-70 family)